MKHHGRARAFDPSEPRDESGKWTDAGGGDRDSMGDSGSASDYGLVPGDAGKFKALKGEWAQVNNDLLAHVDNPDGPESRAALDKLETIVKEIHGLHADPGGPEGIGLPGGPRDVTIVGAGPGGLAASINGAAEGLDTLVVEANVVAGGQAKYSSRIENFPGFPIGVTGERLTKNMFDQAGRLGAESKLGVRVTGMTYDKSTGLKHITLSNGEQFDSRAVILAGGLEFRRLSFPGSDGSGVIVGDGKALARAAAGGPIVVVGGSNGAAQAALGAASNSTHVYLLARSPIVESMSDYQIEALRNNPKVTVIENDQIAKLWRNDHGDPEKVETKSGKTFPAKAIGIFAGSVPETKWLPPEIGRDKTGRLQTNQDLETQLPGVYAIGDMRVGAAGRVGVAVGEGQLALRQANSFLDKQRPKAAGAPAKAFRSRQPQTKAAATSASLISSLFDLDRTNPWFGQTVEGVPPLKPKSNSRKRWERAMPMKPRKDESKDDFMSRCVPDMMGDGKREQDQAVAACMTIWRDKDKSLELSSRDNGDDEDDSTPDDFDDIGEWMDVCQNDQGRDQDDCRQEWDESRAARAERTRAIAAGEVVMKTNASEVSADKEFVLSDESVDRMGDIIMSDGWDVGNFKNNPIALFNHNPNFVIGMWSNIRVGEKKLKAKLQLAPMGTSKRIDEIRKLVDAGILKATSVGFRPLDYEQLDKKNPFSGSKFIKQELVETSLVSVPANPNALAVAKSLNVSSDTLDMVFAKHGNRDRVVRRSFNAKHGKNSQNGKGSAMSLAQRITDLQTYIGVKAAELEAHLATMDDTNVKDADVEKSNLLNQQLASARKQHATLLEAEKNVGGESVVTGNSGGTTRSLTVMTGIPDDNNKRSSLGAPIIIKPPKKDWSSLDLIVHAGVITTASKIWNVSPEAARLKIYGDDEPTKAVHDWLTRAASAPAMTTVTGWAAELVQQVYTDMMALLMPKSVYPRLAAKGLQLTFGRAGRIIVPTRSRTPTLAGSFVGEGMAIPVRQGAFTSQTFTPKKLAVITVWTREMDEHSIPAIEGVLREAVQEDTAVAIDSVLLDANPATTIRPAGLLNTIVALTPTAITGGSLAAIVGDIKGLLGGLTTATFGNVRAPVLLMNPVDLLSASLVTAPNTGIFPFRDEIARGTFANIPFIDSATVPAKTMILVDAADFVSITGDTMRFEISDQATLHMEDTTPLDLVTGSPGTVASPQRSLFQTDSLALRMILPMNWGLRRTGVVAVVTGVTW
jgi:HK97 family phage prohead protease